MSDHKNVDNPPKRGKSEVPESDVAVSSSEVSSLAGSVQTAKTHPRVSSSSDRQIKFERAQKCLENAALVSKRIKEHRKATAELLGRPFEEDEAGDTASEMASTMSERTGYSVSTDTSTTLSVQDALNIPGISESLANTLKQKELLMERIKQYKEISKRPMKTAPFKKESSTDIKIDLKKGKENTDINQLMSTVKEKENAVSILQVRMKAMETTILDLQEKITEKDQIIEAKNKATSLMSDSLSKKEKDSFILLEDTKQQMIKMQENFISMETDWKEEKNRLLKQIEEKNEKITSLEHANTILENSRFEISLAHSKLLEELDMKNNQIMELQQKIEAMSTEGNAMLQKTIQSQEDPEEEKGSKEISDMVELTKKVELLEQLNCQIRQTNKELENKLTSINVDVKSPPSGSPSKKGSPLPSRKGGRSAAKKSPWSQLSSESIPQEVEKKPNKNEVLKLEMVVQSLNKDILDKEYLIAQKDALIDELKSKIAQNQIRIEHSLKVTDVDAAMCTESVDDIKLKERETDANIEPSDGVANVKQLEEKLKNADELIATLKNEIEAANKNMIKVKSNHKLKLKQLQKTIDNFSKISDANAEVIKLNDDLHQLSQKVAELEEEKGNLQLHLVDYDSGRLTESDIYKKMVEMENLAETRLKAISVLEAQKFDLVQELHDLQQKNMEMEDKLADMSHLQSEQVSSEIKSVQLEEQIDQLHGTIKELELVVDNLRLDKEHLEESVKRLEAEKKELIHKLENYIQENMELTDKLEKLSAEKVSSAESMEIVESLTTQEKLELEEYNKGIAEHKQEEVSAPLASPEKIQSLVTQSDDLNKKIEQFTEQRQEVLEKMNKLGIENESLNQRIAEMNNKCTKLQENIEVLSNEKQDMLTLNEELNRQIEDLKRERLEIVKESVEMIKVPTSEESIEGTSSETTHDDKIVGEKGAKGAKTVRQLTKDILKLKSVIKEREAEIADCQMKILSLEEQQQKHNELVQTISSYDSKIKALTTENQQLRDELNSNRQNVDIENKCMLQYQQAQEMLQQDIQKLHMDYTTMINNRDARVQELETLLVEYEKQIYSYGNTIQQKDKELNEYINQITKLNDVSQKLKSTIELLEDEKAKDPNAELVKTLNKQLSATQKILADNEEKLRKYEEDKNQLLSLKTTLENKNNTLDAELKKLHDNYIEKQNQIKELQVQQQKYSEEMANVTLQLKERDEEVHEIKLQLRKESIENEKLRTSLSEKENTYEEYIKRIEDAKQQIQKLDQENQELLENYKSAEVKNKELMEKLKKFAASLKKKSSMYTELEAQLHETQNDLQAKNLQLEQLTIQVDALPALQEKLEYAEEELNRLQSQRASLEQQKSQDTLQLQSEIQMLENKLYSTSSEIKKLNDKLSISHKDLYLTQEENSSLKSQLDVLNNKLADFEIEQKNNMNFITKIASLEAEIIQKQLQITELINQLESQEQKLTQIQFGHDAKIQEQNVYIESLETEITKYKNQICRLEESICTMETRRLTLERKADQLDSQLQEKQKAYSEYTNQEDQLVSRLAVLMDHDRVVEKQLHEIENENKELQLKSQYLIEENHRLKKSLSDIQEYCNTLVDKASRADNADSELVKCHNQIHELEINLKRVMHENQSLLSEKKRQIEEIEMEFNTQIENAIKEKKQLSEKYEKINEHVIQLESKMREYKDTIATLKINIEELHRINDDLIEKSNRDQTQAPDYTEQYINEINKLNSVLNNKNEEFNNLQTKLQTLQNKNTGIVSTYENKIADLEVKIQQSAAYIEQLLNNLDGMKTNNDQLNHLVQQKDQEIKRLTEEKSVTFEMNIPKTEGLVISSTIKPVHEGYKQADISILESQIMTESDLARGDQFASRKKEEQLQKSSDKVSGEISEPAMVAKKAYLCYKNEDIVEQPDDPFNSEEGWGLGESEEVGELTPGMTHLTEQIESFKKQNEKLKSDLDASNNKLIKAMKKLKEIKANNDMLSNELKISKQLSQSSFLDSAMEDELKIKINELEKKLEELTTELNKEKRDKDNLRKQNDVLHNANERWTEIKEKLDNEIELWKYKFKEANDKMSTLQWSTESKDSPHHKHASLDSGSKDEVMKQEIIKLEKENDEFQVVIDQLTSQNKELSLNLTNLRNEIDDLNRKLHDVQSASEKDSITKNQITEFKKKNESLVTRIRELEIRCNEIEHKNETLNTALLANDNKNIDLLEVNKKLEEEIYKLRSVESELEATKSQLLLNEQMQTTLKNQSTDALAIAEKYAAIEDTCQTLKLNLDNANSKMTHLEEENKTLTAKLKEYEQIINELNTKLEHLDTENRELLSTVTELRSSIASTVDQRGFEIAELWKQHLAQREADFQNTESELRRQLEAFQIKYDQLLESVRSSSQEDTEKLVMTEQVMSLQSKLQEKENHLRDIQEKYAEVMNQVDMMRSEIADERMVYENKLMIQQEEYEKQIIQLTNKNHEHSQDYESNYNTLQSELIMAKSKNEELDKQIQELNIKLELSEKIVNVLTNDIKLKDAEIYQKTNELTLTLNQRNEEFDNVRKQLIDYEKKIEDLSYEKESELAIMRLKMHEQTEDFNRARKDMEEENLTLTQELNAKVIEVTKLNKQISDLNKTLEDQSKNAEEMQAALESQELEIVTLKDEISNILKSSKMEKHVTFASDTKPGAEVAEKSQEELTKELLDPVPRAELDLALYMLHQRDVRCEELTMELTQLLEERDTLQLRLSDSLRSYEELKSRCQSAGVDVSASHVPAAELPTYTVEQEQQLADVYRGQTSRSSSISDPDGDKPKLQAKLSELRTVRQSRDVRLRQDSEQRQLALRLLQRDVAQLPPEARDQLAMAHHSLSRDTQSTSTVLLNWLRGKSTPKVVHM